MPRKWQSLSEIMPTFKRISIQQPNLTYSKGKTYKSNGLQLKHLLTSLKIRHLVQTFVRKIKINIASSTPINFQLENENKGYQKRWIKWKGWEVTDNLYALILFLDIIMSIVIFIIGTFQGFIGDFRRADSISIPVIVLKSISLIVFVVRLIMALITIDYVDDKLYIYVVDIIKKQFKGGDILLHIFSMVMVVVTIIIPSDQTVGILSFFSSLLKMILISSNLKILEIEFVKSIRRFYFWNLAKVFIFDLLFGHMLATAFLALSKISPHHNWITVKLVSNGFVDESQTWFIVYIWSYYWACITMLTIGYGDITPVDYRQAIVLSFISIISSIVLAYNINEVGSIISTMRKSSQALDRKLGVLRRMMKKNKVPEELQWRIESYLTHEISIKDEFQYNQHREIIQNLPQQLKEQYFLQSNSQMYGNMPVFHHFQKQTLAKVNKAFVGKVYYPGEYIIKSRVGSNKLIIIKTGQFGLLYWKPESNMNGTIVQSISLQEKQSQGLLINTNIFSRGFHLNYDIMALKYSYGLQLNIEVFLEILKESNLDYYYFKNIFDKHEKQLNTYDYEKCQYCPKQYHTKFQCAKLHYIPNNTLVILKNINSGSRHVKRKKDHHRKKLIFLQHSYYFRKNPFKPLQQALNMSQQYKIQSEDLDIDIPYNFSMYFTQFNPDTYKRKLISRKNKGLQLFGAQILRNCDMKQNNFLRSKVI